MFTGGLGLSDTVIYSVNIYLFYFIYVIYLLIFYLFIIIF